jgi:phenylacetate-CoA ligase
MESNPPPLESLRHLLRALMGSNRFYSERLGRAGVTPENLENLADFSARVGFTGKDDLVLDQAAFPPYGSNLTYPLESYSRYCQTTGTTGNPLLWLDTAESWEWLLGNWRTIYRAVGITAADRIYFAFSFGPFLGFWTAFEAAAQMGCLCLPGGGLSSAARVRAMQVNRVTVLLCTPTYALHLAEAAQSAGVDPGFLRTLIVAGEPGGSIPEVRARISAAWGGARVIDHYGMTELGPVAYEEPQRPGSLRVLEHAYFPEIIDPHTGEAVPAGALGELVLTPLGRFGMPLLRYRTGDLVKRLPGLEEWVLEGGILGRADDMRVVRGVNIFPSAVDGVVRSIPSIGEYRVEMSRKGESLLELTVAIESPEESAVEHLEEALAQAFSLRIPVRRVAAGSLPRFEFKARRWTECP